MPDTSPVVGMHDNSFTHAAGKGNGEKACLESTGHHR